MNIVRGLGRLNDPAKFGSWAYRIVSNKAHDWLRRNGRATSPVVEGEDVPAAAVEQEQRETASDVHGVLRRLPGHSQMVLKLYYLESFDVAEIAQILGTPEGTVKSRLHTDRAEFRKCWESLTGISSAPIRASGKEAQYE